LDDEPEEDDADNEEDSDDEKDIFYGEDSDISYKINTVTPLSGRANTGEPFITTWITTVTNEEIAIGTVGGGYDFEIDWGDGTTGSYSGNP
jgi:hypothetical protein